MKRVSFRDVGLKYMLDPLDEPIIRTEPGETIILEVEDACSGQIRRKGDRRDRSKIPYGNPVLGPIYIENAEKGSTVTVSIEWIKPTTGRGVTYFSEFNEGYIVSPPIFRYMKVSLPRQPKICKIKDGQIYFTDSIVIPYQPMIGTIGVAPSPETESISSGVLPGRHGGNMDLPDVAPSSTVFLPVFHEGALLYVGDVHAVQGDGEISGTAIEMPAEVKIKTGLLDGESTKWPRIETQSEVMSVATTSAGRTLEDAIRTAFLELVIWIEEKHKLNRFDGLMLCSQVGKIRIGNLWTVAAGIDKRYLDAIRE
jgi:amidase